MRRLMLLLGFLGTFLMLETTASAQLWDEPEIQMLEESLISKGLYIVQEGDTLWDLCDLLFDNPWYWPTLWSFNPQITNPHWIFPGDIIYLKPPWAGKVKPSVVWASSRYREEPTDKKILTRFKGFLPEEMYKESGEIHSSREEKNMLGQYDEIYVEFKVPKKIHPGDNFLIYRVLGPVIHPVRDEQVGYKIEFLGVARILHTKSEYKKAVITTSFKEIERGDLITNFVEYVGMTEPVKNETGVLGQIIDIFHPMNIAGEHDYIFIDKGKEDGVADGNRFVINWKGDGIVDVNEGELEAEVLEKLPKEHLGEVMIVKSFDNVSLGVITRSIREFEVGNECEMIRGY
jgi:LysM domain